VDEALPFHLADGCATLAPAAEQKLYACHLRHAGSTRRCALAGQHGPPGGERAGAEGEAAERRQQQSGIFCHQLSATRRLAPHVKQAPRSLEALSAMAQYKLHCFCQSGNSYKVALYLECAKLDWEPVFADFMHGATREPKWRRSVNEMGEAPVLETAAGKLSQSGV